MIFGVFAPQGWKTELAGIEDPRDKWSATLGTALLAEELGFDSIWLYDHVHNVPVPAHEAVFECWTTMAAIAQATTRIRLGQMVSCAGYRNPALVAKITGGSELTFLNYDGLWAAFQFFGDADRTTPIQGGHRVEWVLKISGQPVRLPNGEPLRVVLDVDSAGAPPVFQRGYFAGFTCVARVTR